MRKDLVSASVLLLLYGKLQGVQVQNCNLFEGDLETQFLFQLFFAAYFTAKTCQYVVLFVDETQTVATIYRYILFLRHLLLNSHEKKTK